MQRRQFIKGVGSLALAGPVLRPASVFAAPGSNIIDAHCHIFNGDDLPIVKFVEKVVLPSQEDFKEYVTKYGHVIRFFVRLMADWMRDNAFSAEDEATRLDQIASGAARLRHPDEIRNADISALKSLIEKLNELHHTEGGRFRFREQYVSAILPSIVVGYMHREAYPDTYKHKGLDNIDGEFTWTNWRDFGVLARDLYDGGRGPLSHYLRWGLLFTHYRHELADTLGRIHGGRARLVTPALIDYSNWLNDKYDVKLAAQVKVMGRIARRKGAVRVHGYAPFDPLREALYRDSSSPTGESPLSIAKRAVMEEGFIGVKLYPPMGFLPYDNKTKLFGGDYPEHLKYVAGDFRKKMNGKLDEVLRDLYGWCVSEQVPILAHARDSNGADKDFSKRANPDNWDIVAKTFPGLRFSLAHFGDYKEGFAGPKNPKPKLSGTWEWKMAKLARANPQSQIYIDLSYLDLALFDQNDNRRAELRRMFTDTYKEFSNLKDRLVFGTDWTMLGNEQQFPSLNGGGHYADRILEVLAEAGFDEPARNQIMFGNAAAFLGLNLPATVSGNRKRLKEFYKKYSIDDAWLDSFPVTSS